MTAMSARLREAPFVSISSLLVAELGLLNRVPIPQHSHHHGKGCSDSRCGMLADAGGNSLRAAERITPTPRTCGHQAVGILRCRPRCGAETRDLSHTRVDVRVRSVYSGSAGRGCSLSSLAGLCGIPTCQRTGPARRQQPCPTHCNPGRRTLESRARLDRRVMLTPHLFAPYRRLVDPPVDLARQYGNLHRRHRDRDVWRLEDQRTERGQSSRPRLFWGAPKLNLLPSRCRSGTSPRPSLSRLRG